MARASGKPAKFRRARCRIVWKRVNPAFVLSPVAPDRLCVTRGSIANGEIHEPTTRAFARGSYGDAAQLTFTFAGDCARTRALASGELRRQLGLKLRAADSCNVVYVMWRLDPQPELEVSVKYNPGKHTHAECGASGYTTLGVATVPAPDPGSTHVLRAEIRGDDLHAWIDGGLAWHGPLPVEARALTGPAGLRTDNVRLTALGLAVDQ